MDTPVAQLKLRELLAEVVVDYETLQARVDAALASFNAVVLQIPEHKVSEKSAKALAKGFLKDLGVPSQKCEFVFKCPESATLIGSYATRTLAKPRQSVDIAVRVPKACFYEKDFLNHRYHAKRALYLAVLHEYLCSSEKFQSVDWAFFQQDARKPILVLRPVDGDFQLHVIPTLSDDTFDLAKLGKGRNNVHSEGQLEPTPHYNGTILEDMFVEERSRLEVELLTQSSSLQAATVLLKVWLRQKGFHQYPDSLNGFLVSMLILQFSSAAGGQRITAQMSALQIFRVFLELIGTHNVLAKGVKLKFHAPVKQASVQQDQASVMIVDIHGHANLAMRTSKSALLELKMLATQTLAAMRLDSLDNGFDESFLSKADFPVKFDYHIRIQMTNSESLPVFVDAETWRVDDNKVEALLENCLKDRATLVRALRRGISPGWGPGKRLRKFVTTNLLAGVVVSSFETAFRMVDIGPSADNKTEAALFRSFWGKKAELRRFQDGRITETTAWECESWQRHLIIPRIIEHVLNRHLSIAKENIEAVSGQLDFALLDKDFDPIRWTPSILAAFDTFSKQLRALNLPLKVTSVQPLSAAFRHSAVYPPRPHPGRRFWEPLDVMAQLEGSGRWPNDPIAVEKTKAAFCLQIAESMQKKWNTPFIASEEGVDFVTDGFVFRLFISYEKDQTIVKLKGRPVPHQSRPIHPTNDLVLRSMHASMLYGLQGRCPAFGATVRLSKRWIAAHLFSDIFPEELTELLVAYVFVGQSAPPSTRIPGFLRFLRLLGSHDWSLFPLIVDINEDLSLKDKEGILAQFRKENGPAMFVATSYDLESATWSNIGPSKSEVKRLVAYAKSSAVLLEKAITGEDSRWASLFSTPSSCYDAVIRLHKRSLPFPRRNLFPVDITSKALVVCPDTNLLASELADLDEQIVVGFNPVLEFVKELKEKYGEIFGVWYDALGGDIVGLTFKAKSQQGQKRKRDELKTTLEEIARTGLGLVQSIHTNAD